MRPEIVLIGPIGAGKSTIGRLLSVRLGLPQVSSDALCWDYYREIGFDEADQNGPDGMIAARFNVYAVRRMLQSHQDCVFDLGAGHSVYREPDALEQVRQALDPYPNVVLLLPSTDLDRAERILQVRNEHNDWLSRFRDECGYDPNAHFLRHESNFILARHIVYTQGCTPQQTADAILNLVHGSDRRRG